MNPKMMTKQIDFRINNLDELPQRLPPLTKVLLAAEAGSPVDIRVTDGIGTEYSAQGHRVGMEECVTTKDRAVLFNTGTGSVEIGGRTFPVDTIKTSPAFVEQAQVLSMMLLSTVAIATLLARI